MKVAEYIIQKLADAGITKAFLVYGGAISDLVGALPGRMEYVVCQHEQAAVFAAEGWAKVTGKPGLVIVTSGPGGGNIITGLQNCYYDSVPLIALTGQVSTEFMNPKDSGLRQLGFQETPIVDIVTPITKYAKTLLHAGDVEVVMSRALIDATTKRPGPVLIDIPNNIQREEALYIPSRTIKKVVPLYDNLTAKLTQFLNDLGKSKRPGILVGGGAYEARESIMEFAKAFSIPVFRTWNALDIATDDHPCYAGTIGTYGGPGRNFGIQNTDLLLAIGCRLSGRITGAVPKSFARGAKLYVVDVDPALMISINQPRKADVNILCDAEKLMDHMRVLTSTSSMRPFNFSEWLSQCQDWLVRYDPVKPYRNSPDVHHYAFMRELSIRMPSNAIVVSDTGGNVIMMGHAFQSKEGQRIFTSNGNTPMGFALCGAMGAWFAEPDRPVICIIGDGGMQLNIQELQTIKHYGCKVKVFVINNKILGNTKSYQRVNNKAELACGPDGYSSPDFSKIANAYGIFAAHMDLHIGWPSVIDIVLATNEAVVCDVIHEDFCTYEPRMSRWDAPIEEMYPPLHKKEFLSNMYIEPLIHWEKRR